MSDVNLINSPEFLSNFTNPADGEYIVKMFGSGSIFDVKGYEGKNIGTTGGQRMGGVGLGEGDTNL